MKDNALVSLFWRGLLVGPGESEQAFESRVASLDQQAILSVGDFQLDWVPVQYSNQKLRFWEGGCSWIQDGSVSIQLRDVFSKQNTYLKIYSKQEILQHEAVHAIRVMFDEPSYEEFFAYQTSQFVFRRFIGPLFRYPWESVVTMILIVLFPFFPIALLGFGLFLGLRLAQARRKLQAAKKRLSSLTALSVDALMLGLTDNEVNQFADGTDPISYVKRQDTLRWRQLKAVFFNSELSAE